MAKYNDEYLYIFEGDRMRSLDAIRMRLYDDKPLTPDQRRDLANQLDALMHGVLVMEAE